MVSITERNVVYNVEPGACSLVFLAPVAFSRAMSFLVDILHAFYVAVSLMSCQILDQERETL